MNDIASRLLAIKDQIASLTHQAGRAPDDVQLLAVSKTKPIEAIYAAYQAGQRQFGESYVQEAIPKIQLLQTNPDYADIEWHFIGPLQSNKTKPVAEHFDWVHSVDREKIAQRLNEQRPAHLPALNICLQINISGEQTKSGINADEVFGLAGIISQFPRLKLRGLMTIAENTDDMNIVRDNFLHMQQLFNQLKSQYPSVDTLSMGMTDDMPLAINCGSTMVRIGTAIFGSREYK
jgi:pyridoxal phosphate enzyme (YggS family)